MPENISVLKVENIKKRFGDKEILKGVSFELDRGDIKAIIGPSGGGKSTLLHCINFLTLFDEGHVYLNGIEVDIYEVSKETLALGDNEIYNLLNNQKKFKEC